MHGFIAHSYFVVNTFRPRKNGPHFQDDIFKRIFLNENVWISIKILLKFVLNGPLDNIPALVKIYASLGLSEFSYGFIHAVDLV